LSKSWNIWPGERYYALILGAIYQALRDALNERDARVLHWLFEPAPQCAIARFLGGVSDGAALRATQAVVVRVEELIASGRAGEVRRLLSFRREKELREVFVS
jgi:hypothetical protein